MTTPPPPSAVILKLSGDLYNIATENAVLVHSCNTRGDWDVGTSRRLRELFPIAYSRYRTHCQTHPRASLLGKTLLIPPQENEKWTTGKKQWIACLFTSHDYGKRKGESDGIVEATKGALQDLKAQLKELGWQEDGDEDYGGEERGGEGVPGEIWACKFNSKNFGVEWERSLAVMEEVGLKMFLVNDK
ncbi:putative ADP-ribose 1''-phosphate phosphatase [Cadophora sp. MPI-SDFR-AT-0126]|nr:putative ADP-ribose 1''-phosphate phosphatase [Leotiomycetes sp. MPI-SDFR-AT-0126]